MDSEIAFERIAQLIGCKWSVQIMTTLDDGACRPSEVLRHLEGLAPRVMHRCFRRMERDGLIEKTTLAEVPPHTEYALTAHGRKFIELLGAARQLAETWQGTQKPVRL